MYDVFIIYLFMRKEVLKMRINKAKKRKGMVFNVKFFFMQGCLINYALYRFLTKGVMSLVVQH